MKRNDFFLLEEPSIGTIINLQRVIEQPATKPKEDLQNGKQPKTLEKSLTYGGKIFVDKLY